MSEGQVLGPGEGKVIRLPGATMVFKALSGRASGDYIVGEFTADGGFPGPRPHVHRTHEELFYVLEGEVEIGEVVYTAGACIFIESNTAYGPTRAPKGAKVLRYAEAGVGK